MILLPGIYLSCFLGRKFKIVQLFCDRWNWFSDKFVQLYEFSSSDCCAEISSTAKPVLRNRKFQWV